MNAYGQQSVAHEGLVIQVTTQMSLYNPEKYPRQDLDLQLVKHHHSDLDQSQTA
jgi:hypothetical protein